MKGQDLDKWQKVQKQEHGVCDHGNHFIKAD